MSELAILKENVAPGIVSLTLNRPDKRNALNIHLLQSLCSAIESIQHDPKARVIILKGAGQTFCAGLDMREALDLELSHASAELVARSLETLSQTPLITIAAVHGAAIAGGAGLMTACDIVLAAEGTVVGYPEVRRGLVAGIVMTFLRRRVRESDARELLLIGELIDVNRAMAIGLVNRVVPARLLMEEAVLTARRIMKGAPEALARTKLLLTELWPSSIEDDMHRAMALHKEIRRSDAAREGMAAFIEKRLPRWDPDSGGPAAHS